MSETSGQQVTTGETGRCEKAAHELTHSSRNQQFNESVLQMTIASTIDRLAADVASIKAKVDAVSPEDVAHFVECEKAWVKLVEEQRDAAIRERDQWREEARLAVINRDEARAEVDRLRAELDDREQTEQVDRMREENEILHRASLNYIHDRDQYRRERDEARAEVERLRAELAARQAANHSGIPDSSPAAPQPAAPEPAYYLVTNERDMPIHVSRMHPGVGWDGCTITALYAAPQPEAPPAGWLTEREQHALRHILASDVEPVIRSLLARAGSPPVVEVPELGFLGPMTGREQGIVLAYRDALDAAGVKWKEAGRE